ncbi:RPA family protein [Methanosarcina sp. 2.H.A.1B.4]|jgi:RPA family protein|uniref:RPA family protein n=1 Tax=Methanosarcina sp. 2.H.A.1B.4 TaxID=1483600 RepID=UPI0006213B62|nr:RPA family protein [Methanosarcina sp. 2.H.A.1B.4]KKG09847.1 DNA-binding protein [Methanosarcina sp. 2.H.A.1B.4]
MAGFFREVSRRVFSQELKDSNLTSRDESDQYAPQYLLTPTGAKVNRIFIVGTLIEKEDIGTDSEYWRGRVSDPTGSFLVYAGQYQPEAAQFLAECELPAFIAVIGKTSTYTTDDGNVLTSIRPESIQQVDELTRNLWVLDTAKQTLERIRAVEAQEDPNSKLAKEHYSTDTEIYREMVKKALESLKDNA